MLSRLEGWVEEGYVVEMGKHTGIKGHFVMVYKPNEVTSCAECENPYLDWDDCGHGWTLEEAFEEMDSIVLGDREQTKYKPGDFRD